MIATSPKSANKTTKAFSKSQATHSVSGPTPGKKASPVFAFSKAPTFFNAPHPIMPAMIQAPLHLSTISIQMHYF
jgi:hypothetical protein